MDGVNVRFGEAMIRFGGVDTLAVTSWSVTTMGPTEAAQQE